MKTATLRLGVDLGGTKIEVLALDGAGRECLRRRVPTPQGDYAATLDTVGRLVESAEAELGERGSVGIAIPGAISRVTGLIKNANSVCLIGKPLQADLEHRLGRPVRLSNDANCLALSEAVDGAGRDAELVFGVILGTGIGGGIAIGRRVLTGANAIAGEWGHNPLPWPEDGERPGPVCYCGRRGCLETWLSGPGMAERHRETTGQRLDAATLAARATQGDAVARGALERYADRLARGLAHIINLLDPQVIVLGGGLSNIDWLYEAVPVRWERYVFSDRVDTQLLPPVHGDSSGVRGAAWLWGGADV
ncbi:MAG: ROK family protein [Acidihalobacter sp.]|uniref:ROK family protein n=1 Tax=Acidihalobacter sp. TaxID=1872108 RepID=UPI00307EAF90